MQSRLNSHSGPSRPRYAKRERSIPACVSPQRPMLDLTLASPRWLLGRLLLARYSLHGHSELSLDVQRIATLAQIAHLFHRTKDSEHFSAYRNLRPPSLENFVTIASLIAGLLDRLPQHLKAFSSFFLVGTCSVRVRPRPICWGCLPRLNPTCSR